MKQVRRNATNGRSRERRVTYIGIVPFAVAVRPVKTRLREPEKCIVRTAVGVCEVGVPV